MHVYRVSLARSLTFFPLDPSPRQARTCRSCCALTSRASAWGREVRGQETPPGAWKAGTSVEGKGGWVRWEAGGWGKEGSPVRWAHSPSSGIPGSWLEGSLWQPGLGGLAPKEAGSAPRSLVLMAELSTSFSRSAPPCTPVHVEGDKGSWCLWSPSVLQELGSIHNRDHSTSSPKAPGTAWYQVTLPRTRKQQGSKPTSHSQNTNPRVPLNTKP